MAASGGGKGALENRWRGLSIRAHTPGQVLLLLHTHPDLRRAPRSLVGVEDVDLVVPPPTPEERVSDHGLRDQRSVNHGHEKVVPFPKVNPLTQDSSSMMKLAAGVVCISPMVLHPYPPK